MREHSQGLDRLTECLLRNGDLSCCGDQEMYEMAWELGIQGVDEGPLKPKKRNRRREPRMDRIQSVDLEDRPCMA